MKKNIPTRLKDYLLDIMKREKDAEAWIYFKTLNPSCDDLDNVIIFTDFAQEAWAEFKKMAFTSDDLLAILKRTEDEDIKAEAAALLLQNFASDAKCLQELVEATRSDEAAKLLLNQSPDNEQLSSILCYSNLCDEAAKEMLKVEQEPRELLEIIQYSSFKNEAWTRLIAQSPSVEDIITVIQESDYDDVAWAYLRAQKPTNDDVSDLVNDYGKSGKKREEAADYILNNNPNISDLTDLIWNKIRINDAWELLQNMQPDESDLSAAIWRLVRLESCMKNEAAQWALKFNPEKADLWYILEYSNQKDAAALQLLNTDLELHELADIIVNSTIEPVLEHISKQVNFDRNSADEYKLIREIANKILAEPNLLTANNWHNNDSHCLGGWAIILTPQAQEIEQLYGSEIAACLLLPNYKHLFFADKESVLNELTNILTK